MKVGYSYSWFQENDRKPYTKRNQQQLIAVFLSLPFMQCKTLLLSFFLLVVISARAQTRYPLAHFNGMQTGKAIQITFVIRSGSVCDGVKILRSSNEYDFLEIGQLTGVCGNDKSDETYSFTDVWPVKNADNFYRLELVNLTKSDVIKVRFTDFGDKGFVLFPDTVKDKSMLYFQNDCNDEFDFVLFDKKRKKVKEIKDIRSNAVELTKGTLKSGTYTFQLLIDNKVKYNGSLVIL